nr:glycosyltransferase [Lunatimonas salinarum]
MSATSDKRKGFTYLAEAIKRLDFDEEEVEILVLGASQSVNSPVFRYRTIYLGKFQDDLAINLVFNAADISVVPSLQENLSNFIMESMSSGTGVVCFDIGGNSDMVNHKVTGYLASEVSGIDLALGISWSIHHSVELGKGSRRFVLENFSGEVVVKRYLDFSTRFLKNHPIAR